MFTRLEYFSTNCLPVRLPSTSNNLRRQRTMKSAASLGKQSHQGRAPRSAHWVKRLHRFHHNEGLTPRTVEIPPWRSGRHRDEVAGEGSDTTIRDSKQSCCRYSAVHLPRANSGKISFIALSFLEVRKTEPNGTCLCCRCAGICLWRLSLHRLKLCPYPTSISKIAGFRL